MIFFELVRVENIIRKKKYANIFIHEEKHTLFSYENSYNAMTTMQVTHIQQFQQHFGLNLPIFAESVSAGFPSPADDFIDTKLDLNEHLVKHPAATFFVRVSGNSMKEAGIFSEDILIVDRSLDPHNNSIVVVILNGELLIKRLKIDKKRIFLVSGNSAYKAIEVTEDEDFRIWGVVTSVIHKIKNI